MPRRRTLATALAVAALAVAAAAQQHSPLPADPAATEWRSHRLVFIGATDDSRFPAFDVKTGTELRVEKLPASSHSVPVTYMGRNGKQYLVFPSTRGSLLQDPALSDELLAYALP